MKNVKVRGKRRIPRKKDEFRGKKANSAAKIRGSAHKNPNSAAQFEIPRKTVGPTYQMPSFPTGPLYETKLMYTFMSGPKRESVIEFCPYALTPFY